MENIQKFQDLKVDSTYSVLSFSSPIHSKYGISYILNIDDEFEMWSTNSLAGYISTEKPTKKFNFTVKERKDSKYPVIEGYKKGFTILE